MKRKSKLFYSLPLLLCGALLFSCGTGGDNVEEDPGENNDTVVPGDGTIAGAGLDDIYDYNEEMDGSTRPNYEDIFDYESEYEPDVPDPTGTVNVTFVLPDGVTLTDEYKNYYSEVEVYGNVFLPTGTSEYLQYSSSDITVQGWASYDAESDNYTFISTTYYSVGREDVTLYAYVSDSRGYDVTELSRVSDSASGVIDYVGEVTFDVEGNVSSIDASTSVSGYSNRDYLINGKYGGRITYEGTLTDEFARIMSVPPTELESVEADVNYNIYYTLVNYGSETINVQVSQMRSGTNYTSGVVSDWHQIAPGESVDFTILFDSQSENAHLLTGLVVKGTVADFDLGFQMAMDYYDENPEVAYVTVTYVLPSNVSLSESFIEANSQVDKNSTLSLPTGNNEALSYTDNSQLVQGWATYTETSDTYTDVGSSYSVRSSDVTLYAYTNDSRGDDVSEFDRSDANRTDMVDYIGTATIDENGDVSDVSATAGTAEYSWSTNYIIDGKFGTKLTYSGTLNNSYARFMSRPLSSDGDGTYTSLTTNATYDFSYTLYNYGAVDVTIQVSQIPSSNNYKASDGGILSSWYTIEPSSSVSFTLENYTETRTSPTNIITGFVVKGECTDFAVGFQMAYQEQ